MHLADSFKLGYCKKMPKKRFEHNNHTNSVFLVVVLALQLVIFLLTYIVYEAWNSAFGWHGIWLSAVLASLSVSFLASMFLSMKYRGWFLRLYSSLASHWIACLGPLFGGAIIFAIIADFSFMVGIQVSLLYAGIFSFGATLIFLLSGIWQSRRAGTTKVTVALPNTPASWIGKKIVFVSDLHLGNVYGKNFSKKVVKKIQALSPEIVLIGGDMFDGPKCFPEELMAPWKELTPPQGIYFITGNHEYLGDAPAFLSAIRGVGIHILENEVVDVNGLQIAGVDWEDSARREDFKTTFDEMKFDASRPSILIKHVPDALDIIAARGISLELSGHTHRGQFWPLSILTKRLFKGYDYGLKKMDDMFVYTSSGVGTWGPPFRFLTKSEIVEITLK